jgi:hypothetical protein
MDSMCVPLPRLPALCCSWNTGDDMNTPVLVVVLLPLAVARSPAVMKDADQLLPMWGAALGAPLLLM